MLLRYSLPTSNVELESNVALYSLGKLDPGLLNHPIKSF